MGKKVADRVQQNRLEGYSTNFGIFDICKYGDMYVDKLRIRIKNEFWDHFLQAIKHLYQTYNSGWIDRNWINPHFFNSDINLTYRKSWELKRFYWISDLFDSWWNFLSGDQIDAFLHIAINFLDYENLGFLVRKRLEKYNSNKVTLIGPKLPIILNIIKISDKGCGNVYKQLLNNNNNVIREIRWTSKLNEEIDYSLVANSFRINYRTTNDTFVRLIQFKLAHHRVMTNALLFKMNFVASPTCAHCSEVETVMHAFF